MRDGADPGPPDADPRRTADAQFEAIEAARRGVPHAGQGQRGRARIWRATCTGRWRRSPIRTEEEPKPPEGEQGKIIAVIPVNPVAMAAFRRAAQGLPPEPRKTL